MNYNSTLLTTVADCDIVLSFANRDKAALLHRKSSLEWQHSSYENNSVELEAELQAVNAQIAALETVIAGLPEGPVKAKSIVDKTKAEYKRFILGEQKNNYGVIALLDKEYDINCVEQEIEATDAFIAEITNRRNEL